MVQTTIPDTLDVGSTAADDEASGEFELPLAIAAELLANSRERQSWRQWLASRIYGPPNQSGLSERLAFAIQNTDDADLALRILEVHARAADNDARKAYGKIIIRLTALWLFLVLLTIWASACSVQFPAANWFGGRVTPQPFKMSDATLIALMTTTTANVLALTLVVATSLFPSKKTQQVSDR